jgi:exosortase
MREYVNQRNAFFFIFFILAFLMAYGPIKALYNSSINSEYYSHIVLIPLVSIYFLYQERRDIFAEKEYSHLIGLPLLMIGALLFFGGRFYGTQLNQNDFTAIIVLSAVVVIHGAFIFCYGIQAFKAALFSLLFLIFMIPLPSALMDGIIYALQVGSTEFTNVLLLATGVPFVREGFVFHLPNISVEVAKQCSGIRSGLALLITATVAGHLFLKTGWKKVLLALVSIPIAMFKNGIRIVTLTLLGAYVDPRILQSDLHREGGIPFFIVALLLLVPVLYYLRRSEGKGARDKIQQ